MKMIMILLLLCFSKLSAQTTFPEGFIFGVANAPGQVEDQLDDIWLAWGNQGKISAWKEVASPEKRLEFWTKPEIELDLAKNLGVHSFRMGIDWGRVMTSKTSFDLNAINRYHQIIQSVKSRKLKIMMTLSHHSVPKWVQEMGGWHNEETKKAFLLFSQTMMEEFNNDVDWWITFNEGNVFATMAYTMGIWPPGEKHSPAALLALGPLRGTSIEAMDNMADVHNEVYEWAHKKFPKIKIGLAHNLAYYTGKDWVDETKSWFVDRIMNWRFPERVRGKMDFFGFNYYGAEWIKGPKIEISPEEEYSEAGRAIHVNGLYHLLKEIHQRFTGLPIIITENGIADANDSIRSAYIIEHLLAVNEAIKNKIPVVGYYVWSLTDNLEWSDGYCPKFGLVSVDRMTMERRPRESYYLFKEIIQQHAISKLQRETAWEKVMNFQGKDRPFCRDEDGITAFNQPRLRKFSNKDWRFQN